MSKLEKTLDKSKKTREDYIELLVKEQENSRSQPTMHRKEIMKIHNHFDFSYSSTRIQESDFQKLKDKKIIPVCYGCETADQVKILRTQIMAKLIDEGKNTLLITSANPGEGKTLTAINLAISVAHQINCTVLLVDADLRKPSIHNLFELDADRGLSDYLLGKVEIPDILINPGIPRLVILPGGKPITASSEHLGAPRMVSLIKEMKERYSDRFIIFDSSPLLTSADPLALSRYMDSILIVVEAEKTTREDIQGVMELLKDKPVIGTVFNKTKG